MTLRFSLVDGWPNRIRDGKRFVQGHTATASSGSSPCFGHCSGRSHISPLKDQAGQSLSLSAWEGLEKRWNWSLGIFIEGMNNRVAVFSSSSWDPSPDRASTSAGAPKGSGGIDLSSILKLAGAPTCHEPALLPALRS